MKKIFKYSLLMLSVVAAFVACKDEDRTAPGEWDANPNYANVYFENTTQQVELDPTAATTATIAIYRRDTIGARTIKMDVAENTDGVFTVGDAVFADGDSVAYITVDFPKAEIGKTYTLTLTSSDPDLVSSYSQDVSYTLNVTRIKWNLVGKGTIQDNFKYCFNQASGQFDVYVRDDDPMKFRFDNLFDEIAANAGLTLDGNQTQQAFVSILKKGDVLGGVTVTQSDLIGFEEDLNTGYVMPDYGAEILICHPYGFSSTHEESNWSHNKVLGYQENGLPTQIQIAPFYYMNGVGGWNYTQQDKMVIITFPGYEPVVTYEAKFDDDFEWSDVKTFDLTNSETGEVSSNIMLQKAVCTVTTDNCDSVFLEQYGVPYRIQNAFAQGYDLYFFVKSGKIVIPEDFEDYFFLQETGLTTEPMKTPIYAMINTDESRFNTVEIDDSIDVTDVTLNITFTDEDGGKDFGTADIILNNVTWTQIGTGTYTYVGGASAMQQEGPIPDEGLPFSKRDDKDDIFKISHWFYDVDFQFTWDKETNACVIPVQYTGLSFEGYGDVYVCDVAEFTGNPAYYENFPCTFNPETQTFSFNPIYFIYQEPNKYQWLGDDPETFVLDVDGVKALKAPLTVKLNLNNARRIFKRKNVWKGVKLAQPYSSKPAFQRFTR